MKILVFLQCLLLFYLAISNYSYDLQVKYLHKNITIVQENIDNVNREVFYLNSRVSTNENLEKIDFLVKNYTKLVPEKPRQHIKYSKYLNVNKRRNEK